MNGKVIIYAGKSSTFLSSAQSLPSSTRKPKLYTIYMDYILFSSVLLSPKEGKEVTSLTVAMDHKNVHDNTAFQAVP